MKIDFVDEIIGNLEAILIYVNGRQLRLKDRYPVILLPTGEYADVNQEIPLYVIYVILEHYDDIDAIREERDLFPLSFIQYTLSEIEDIFRNIGSGIRVEI